jgi:cell division septum initiation protein DivIVA
MINVNEKDPVVQNYRAALAELQKLQGELGRVSEDIDAKTQKLVSLRQRSQAERLADEAEAMLSSGVINESSGLIEEINRLEHRRDVLETAIELQGHVVDRVRGPYSLMVNESQRARHKEIVSRIATGMRQVAAGFDDEIRLFDELAQAEAAVMLRPMRVNTIGSLRDQNSIATFFIRELKEYFPEIKL